MMAVSRLSGPLKYDVFINFRGEDTRKIFIGHLYKALKDEAISAFYDQFLEKGFRFSKLLEAIDDSRLSIVVFSQNYANSTWCLRELDRIVKCMDMHGQMVVPIFYGVDPSDIRKLKGNFATAFEKHDRDPEINQEELKSWKSALKQVSNINGWISKNYECDSVLITDIVKDIVNKQNPISSSQADYLVGMDNHIREMNLLLCPGMDDVRCIAICGIGGICISTIAKATYDEIHGQFQRFCFFENFKKDFKQLGAAYMQEKLLNTILGDCNTGFNVTKMEKLGEHKVLLVLDGVECFTQIEALLGKQCSFGGGSRIIITTTDIQPLSGVDGIITNLQKESRYIYWPKVLSDEEVRKLIFQPAFGTMQHTRGFNNLIRHAIEYVQGLPSALRALGNFFLEFPTLVFNYCC